MSFHPVPIQFTVYFFSGLLNNSIVLFKMWIHIFIAGPAEKGVQRILTGKSKTCTFKRPYFVQPHIFRVFRPSTSTELTYLTNLKLQYLYGKNRAAKIHPEMKTQCLKCKKEAFEIVFKNKIVDFSNTSLIESSSRRSRIFPSHTT